MKAERDLDVLEHIFQNQDSVRQRDLAHITGVSLGMINVILKRLTAKGWIKIKKINNRNIQYIVSPEGLEVISHRSYDFFKRTIKNLVFYKDIIEKLILDIKRKGFVNIDLIGRSEVDFLIDHFCMKYGMIFTLRINDPIQNGFSIQEGNERFFLFSEDILKDNSDGDRTIENCFYLREVLLK